MSRSAVEHPPRVSIAYERDRERAGNKLFCPSYFPSPLLLAKKIPPYEEAARLVQLLNALGLAPDLDPGNAILIIARTLSVAGARYASRTSVAEYLVYRLRGIPHASSIKDKFLFQAIENFYAKWLAKSAIRPEWCRLQK